VTCDAVERDLHAYVDRELDAQTTASVRTHTQDCDDCRRRVAAIEALGRLVRATPRYAAPDRLRSRLPRVPQKPRRNGSSPRCCRAGFAVGSGAPAATSASAQQPGAGRRRRRSRALADGGHPFDVQSTISTRRPEQGRLSPPSRPASTGFAGWGRLGTWATASGQALVYQRRSIAINVKRSWA
jgi:anti-sigma factor RsiW